MSAPERPSTAAGKKSKSPFPKGSKVTCEAAGWQFLPITSHAREDVWQDGRCVGQRRTRIAGGRGIEAVPPSGSGIEPRNFGGMNRAVAWAVEQLGRATTLPPDRTPAGMDGIRLMLAAALASGEVCGGPDEAPERPDGRLLTAAREVLGAKATDGACRTTTSAAKLPHGILASAIDQRGASARLLPTLQATTREGLILKARAALAAIDSLRLTAREQVEILQSLALDLIELVPTLIDERGRSIVPQAPRTGKAA